MEKSGIYIHQNGYLRVKSWRASVPVAATRNKMPIESRHQNFIDAADVNVAVESEQRTMETESVYMCVHEL